LRKEAVKIITVENLPFGGNPNAGYDDQGERVVIGPEYANEVLEICERFLTDCSVTQRIVALKQSAELTEADRASLAQHIMTSNAEVILVPTGTRTILETHKYLLDRQDVMRAIRQKNQNVCLFSCIRPYQHRESDLPTNVVAAFVAATYWAGGHIYAAMGGRRYEFGDYEVGPDGQLHNTFK